MWAVASCMVGHGAQWRAWLLCRGCLQRCTCYTCNIIFIYYYCIIVYCAWGSICPFVYYLSVHLSYELSINIPLNIPLAFNIMINLSIGGFPQRAKSSTELISKIRWRVGLISLYTLWASTYLSHHLKIFIKLLKSIKLIIYQSFFSISISKLNGWEITKKV